MFPLFACLLIAATTALPTNDPVISRLGGDRFQHMRGGDGIMRLVDTWIKVSDLRESARYAPASENVYHLFTRDNPTVSQPLLLGADGLLGASNFNPSRRTIVILHGWIDSIVGDIFSVLIPAFLAAEDVNVIGVDWSAGASTINYVAAVRNTLTSGETVARFIKWLNLSTGSSPVQFHIVGHSLGGHQAGIIGRNLNGNVAYITALDPAMPGFITNNNKFRADDGAYTEVIHTNAGLLGYISDLGQVDFYPNGGNSMAGCGISPSCDHERSFHYLAESLRTGGFTGTRCATNIGALIGICSQQGSLQMGGIAPKTGSSGIYYLRTNARPPFSRD